MRDLYICEQLPVAHKYSLTPVHSFSTVNKRKQSSVIKYIIYIYELLFYKLIRAKKRAAAAAALELI